MSTIQVQGLQPLKGEVEIQGSKNAVLPMMAAAILHKGTTVITNVPRIQDVYCMMGILEFLGCTCVFSRNTLTIDASVLTSIRIPEYYVKSMRSSIMVLGALLGRAGEAVTHYPGGCSIGKRPIDLHLYALRKLGATIKEEDEMILASAGNLKGTEIEFCFPSVGATENAVLAAVLAKGTTIIRGCAREPEIEELCLFLVNMGASIEGIGTDCLTVSGQNKLHDSSYRVAGDRIVAGTYLSAGMISMGEVIVTGIKPSHMTAVLTEFKNAGAKLDVLTDAVRISTEKRPRPLFIKTGPYPEFPTDLQSLMMAVLSISSGSSEIEETIFEGRYETAKELQKLGAKIRVRDSRAQIEGRYPLSANIVEAKDLRGGAALVIAGLATEGVTEIISCQHILRGYEDICRDLSCLGAAVTFKINP